MPPQVGKADGAGSTVPQLPPPAVQKDDSKSTSSADTSAAKTQTAETKSGTSTQQKKEPEDPKAAARQAQGSKQNAIAKKKEQNDQAQMVQKDLQKRVPASKTESIYESAKQVAEFVAIKVPIAAAVVAEEASNAGAEHVRQQKVEQLGRRTHPQDMVKGQLFEIEDITPSSSDKIRTDKKTEATSASAATIASSGKVLEYVDHPKQHRQATQSGVAERLKELNGGAPLTDFEKELVSDWSKRSGKDKTLTPIKGIDSKGEKMDKEVQAYKITTGGSGQRHTNYYDRNGNVLREAGTSEPPLVNEGLGPIEYLGYAQLVKNVATNVGKKVSEKLAAREAAAVLKAETGAATRTAEQQVVKTETGAAARSAEQEAATQPRQTNTAVGNANTQPGPAQRPVQGRPLDDTHPVQDTVRTDAARSTTQPGPAQRPVQGRPLDDTPPIQDTVSTPTRQPSQSTPASQQTKSTTGGGSDSGGKGPVESRELQKGEYIRQRPLENRPSIPDSDPITITTATGRSQMTVGQYRSKVGQAKEWISQQMRKNPGWNHDFAGLNKQAAEKFGLDKDWARLNNPYTYGRL